ncbi:MAG: hypothetical protein OEY52_05700 [Gammaproteobacteria bacterium]|nr:hypothetical protein [Gammaproteobacteria bacterium]
MKKYFKSILSVLFLFLVTTNISQALEGDTPGKLIKGKAVYDGKRYVLLHPASLFDADSSPSTFRLGVVWDERYGEELRLIIQFPISEQTNMEDLKKSAGTFEISIDGKPEQLTRVKDSIILNRESGVFSKTYDAEIRFTGSRKLLKKILSASNVQFSVNVLLKKHQATLKVTSKSQENFHNREYTAIHGLKRFYKAVWGEE